LLYAYWTFWVLTILANAFVVYLLVAQRLFCRFLFLSLYFLLVVAFGMGQYFLVARPHWNWVGSIEFYYLSEFVLAVALFAGVWQLSVRLGFAKGDLRLACWSVPVLLALMLFHLAVELESTRFSHARFFTPPWQDVQFVCGVMVLSLWIWKVRHVARDQTAARLVNVLSVYFLLLFAVYAARMSDSLDIRMQAQVPVYHLSSEAAAWLPLGSAFALLFRDHAH
jgi:hypothetical protein